MPEPSTSSSNNDSGQKPSIKLKFKPKEGTPPPAQQPVEPAPQQQAPSAPKGLSIKRPPSETAPAAPAGMAGPVPPPSLKPSLSTAPQAPVPPPSSGPKPPPGVKLITTPLIDEPAPSGPKIKLSFSSPKLKNPAPGQPPPAKPAAPQPKAQQPAAPAHKPLNPLILVGAFALIVTILLGGMFVLLLMKQTQEAPVAPAPLAPATHEPVASRTPVAEEVVLTGSTAAVAVDAPEMEIPSTPETLVASLSPSLLHSEDGIALVVDNVVYPANTIIDPDLGVRFAGFRESTNEAVFQDAKGNTFTRKF